jgi:hypothetical protein
MSQLKLLAGFLRSILIISGAVLFAVSSTIARESDDASPSPAVSAPVAFRATDWNTSRLGALDQRVFNLALNAASCAVHSGKVTAPTTLTVIDYSKPSTQKRLWVVDLRTHALLFEELVAHGQGSGNNLATRFSNEPERIARASAFSKRRSLHRQERLLASARGTRRRLQRSRHGPGDRDARCRTSAK